MGFSPAELCFFATSSAYREVTTPIEWGDTKGEFVYRKILAGAACATVLSLAFVAPVGAVDSFVTEPFDTAGDIPEGWISKGNPDDPFIAEESGDTPEFALRLTEALGTQAGWVLYKQPLSTAQGLDITFEQAQFDAPDDSGEADGIVFFLKDATNSSNKPGGSGGGLGYIDMPGAVLGVGLDAYGNFAPSGGTGGPCPDTDASFSPNSIAVIGGQSDFCLLTDPYLLEDEGLDPLVDRYLTRADAARTVRITIDPVTADDARIMVYYEGTLVFDIPLPEDLKSVENVKLGFSAGTGGSVNKHDVWSVGAQVADPFYDPPAQPAESSELAATGLNSSVPSQLMSFSLLLSLAGTAFLIARRRSRKKSYS